ncbi:MAG: hypothetical protein JW959_03370 [Pirellulales bacterium]|nr:hypothetical protein [Pirellulales bacterium]
MKLLRVRWLSLKIAFISLVCWLSIHGDVLAQAKKNTEKAVGDSSTTAGGAYVMAYGLVILSVTLGLLFVCRTSNRRDRAKPEVYGESKVETDKEQ